MIKGAELKIRQNIIAFFLIILSISPLFAGEDAYTLKIATMELPPYGWVDEKGEKKGIIFEMTQEIGIRSGLPFEHNIYPFNRMLKMLRAGKIDILSSQAHQKALDAGEKLAIQFKIDVIAATKKNADINNIAGFKGKDLIFHQGASYKQLEGIPRDIKLVNSYEEALKLLHKRSTWFGAVFSEPAYYYFMKKLNRTPDDFGNVIYIERNKEQWIFVRRDLPDQIKKNLKDIVNDIYKEGAYEKMLSKYGKPK